MTGTIELDADGAHLLIRFDYRPDLVDLVRGFQGRRWDPRAKVWKVPAKEVDRVVSSLLIYGFSMAAEVSGMLAGTVTAPKSPQRPAESATQPARTTAAPPPAVGAPAAAPESWTVSSLNQRVKGALLDAFPETVWLVGEILDFDKVRDREHKFFALVEKAPGESRPMAQVQVALFARTAAALFRRLEAAQPPLTLRDGLEIRVRAKVDFYPAAGRFQLIIEDIDAAHTLGRMALQRDQILSELRDRGLIRRNLDLVVPEPALRIAVLASLSSDGWNDFLRELQASGLAFAITGYDVKVQGPELRPTMLRGLRWFAERAADHDVLCILRGGGSRSDLAWFDDRDVALAVARHPLKIICGIGHERDHSVLDYIAESLKTPTAAAAFLVERAQRVIAALDTQARALIRAARSVLQREREWLRARSLDLRRTLPARLRSERQVLDERGRTLCRSAEWLIARQRQWLSQSQQLLHAGSRRRVEKAAAFLDQQATRQRLLDPRRVVARGYAIVRRAAQGSIVTQASAVRGGDPLDLDFRDGRVRVTAGEVTIERRSKDGRQEEDH
jgi:exodeoxyribonuclease VII large subunit